MSNPQLMTYKNPDGPEFSCLDCPLPECHEGSPGCLYWEAKQKAPKERRWAGLIAEVKGLRPGGLLVKELPAKEARSAQASIGWYRRVGQIPEGIKTWRIKQSQGALLNILRKGEK